MMKKRSASNAFTISTPAKATKTAATVVRKKKTIAKPMALYKPVASLGLPETMCVKMKYVESVGFATTSGVLAKYVFSCNSVYDPNVTSTGHQPLYFDIMTSIYNHYTVISSVGKFIFTPRSTATNAAAAMCGVYIDDDGTTTPVTKAQTFAEQKNAVLMQMPVNNGQPRTRTLYWNAAKLLGVTNPLDDSTLQGSASTNPTETSAFVCFMQCNDLSSSATVELVADITYTVVWSELKEQQES